MEVIKQQLFKHKLMGRRMLLCVSGGLDSMVLLKMLSDLREQFHLHLSVVSVHHGTQQNLEFRNKAIQLVMDECCKLELPFLSNEPEKLDLQCESDLRTYRLEVIKKAQSNNEIIVFAHHRDDLLETRMIRLIRGVGFEGLKSMEIFKDETYRPFLELSRGELENYAQKNDICYLEDPTNSEEKYLRNWLRNQWLPQLEGFRPGSLKGLSRSLENLVPEFKDNISFISDKGINRNAVLGLSERQKRTIFAQYLNQKNVKNYTTGQIDEVIKRLDSVQNELIFRVMGCDWTVDSKHISID